MDAPDLTAQARREASLVAAVRRGDERAFGEVFDAYHARLCAFAAGTVGDEAREVVVGVFVRVWERRAEWDVRHSLKAYLYGATRNAALNHADRVRRRAAHEQPMSESLDPASPHTPEDDLRHAELAEAVWAAVERLPEKRRAAFVLHRQHELTYGEIAEALGISAKTVENQIGRALKEIRASLPADLLPDA